MKMNCVQVLALTLALVLCTSDARSLESPSPSPDGFLPVPQRYHVRIVNSLSQGDLTVHCKSGDDDLGSHMVPVSQFYEFSFKLAIFGRTLFFCNLWHGNQNQFHTVFDAFKVKPSFFRECGQPGTMCMWIAKDDGVYLHNSKTGADVFKYKWDGAMDIAGKAPFIF